MNRASLVFLILTALGPSALGQVSFPFEPTSYPAPNQPSGLALADFDASGLPDLAYTQLGNGRLNLRLNLGDGTFSAPFPVAQVPGANGLAAGEINGDARPDLAVLSDLQDRVALFTGQGAASFATKGDVPITGDLISIELHDMDGDGLDELLVCDGTLSQLTVFPNLGAATFGSPIAVPLIGPAADVVVGDLDGDPWPDLVTSAYFWSSGSVVRGGPGLAFQPATFMPSSFGGIAVSVSLGEFNGDGLTDLVVSEDGGLDRDMVVWEGLGNGTFGSELFVTWDGLAVQENAAGDYNGDGRGDFIVVLGSTGVNGFAGIGDGSFWGPSGQTPAGGWVSELEVADLDGDGVLDAVTAAVGSGVLTVLLARPEELSAKIDKFYASSAGAKDYEMALLVGPQYAGDLYVALGTTSGIDPGLPLAGQHLPLNPDPYTTFVLAAPGALIQGSPGYLDAVGSGTATLVLGAGALPPQASGLILNHAFVVLDSLTGQVEKITSALTLTLI